MHSAATSGLIDFTFIGDLIALLTVDGRLLVIAVDKSVERMHTVMFEERIPDCL